MIELKQGVRAAVAFTTLVTTAVFADAPATGAHFASDAAKSTLEFQFVQAGAQNKGKFAKFPVALDAAADGSAVSRLDVTVDMTTMDSGDKERDDTLRGPDLFDVAKFTQTHFVATQLNKSASGFDALGKLTLRGVTHDQHVLFTLRSASEQGHSVLYLTGKTTVHRLDYGVGQGEWKSTEWVGSDVVVSYNVRLIAGQ